MKLCTGIVSITVARRGFTLIELLVVISVIAILATMLLPTIAMVRGHANRAACGKNQQQIVMSCVAYAQDQGTSWPFGHWTVNVANPMPAPASSQEAAQVTARSFEVLAASMNLGNALFKCKGVSHKTPSTKPVKDATNGNSWGWGSGGHIPYAYDWSVPGDPASVRVVLADRTYANHGSTGAMAAIVDGSIRFFKVTKGAGPIGGSPNVTVDTTNAAVGGTTMSLFNPDSLGTDDETDTATGDNIYDTNKDITTAGQDALKSGSGSLRRACVR